jgi:hypothetical protein
MCFRLAPEAGEECIEQRGGLISVPRPRRPGGQRFAGVLVDHVEKPDLAAGAGAVVLVVQRPHMIWVQRLVPSLPSTWTQAAFLTHLGWSLQPFQLPQPVCSLGVDHQTLRTCDRMSLTPTPPGMLSGDPA